MDRQFRKNERRKFRADRELWPMAPEFCPRDHVQQPQRWNGERYSESGEERWLDTLDFIKKWRMPLKAWR